MDRETLTGRFAVMNNAYMRFSLDYAFESLHRLGVRNVDLWAGEPHFYVADASYEDVQRLGRLAACRELSLVCLTPEMLGYPYNIAAKEPDFRERTWQYGKKCLDVAQDLGIPLVLFGPGWRYETESREEGRRRAAEMLARLGGYAVRKGVAVAIQHLTRASSNLVNSAEELKALLTQTPAPLRAAVDVSIIYGLGEQIEPYQSALGPDLCHLHFMDGHVGRPSAHLAVGDGELALREIYQKLEQGGYRGFYTLEINAPQYLDEPERGIESSLARLAAWQPREQI